jgi:hypothetical protein
MGEERRPVLEQQADAVAGAIAGMRVQPAQPLGFALDLAPATRTALNRVRTGGDGIDDEQVGVAAAGGDALEGRMDSGGSGIQGNLR